jgi:uncharacterized Zn finger protein
LAARTSHDAGRAIGDGAARRRLIRRWAHWIVDSLLEILLAEGRSDEAWTTAVECDYRGPLMMRLAEAREATAPLDAVDVYEPVVGRLIASMTNDAYASAVQLMDRIRGLCDAAGAPARFAALLADVRTTHRAKRNLKKLLDQRGWD